MKLTVDGSPGSDVARDSRTYLGERIVLIRVAVLDIVRTDGEHTASTEILARPEMPRP